MPLHRQPDQWFIGELVTSSEFDGVGRVTKIGSENSSVCLWLWVEVLSFDRQRVWVRAVDCSPWHEDAPTT